MLVSTGAAVALTAASAVRASVGAPPSIARVLTVADFAALVVASASVLSKEFLFRASHAIGTRCQSPSIVANAYHHRSDALSSLVAIVTYVFSTSL